MEQEKMKVFVEEAEEFIENPEKAIITVDGENYVREDVTELYGEVTAGMGAVKAVAYVAATAFGIWAVRKVCKKLHSLI